MNMGEELKERKPIEEFLNLSMMNIVKAIDKLSGEIAVLSDRIEKLNWNAGSAVKILKEQQEKK
jgi:hypothetical protein